MLWKPKHAKDGDNGDEESRADVVSAECADFGLRARAQLASEEERLQDTED